MRHRLCRDGQVLLHWVVRVRLGPRDDEGHSQAALKPRTLFIPERSVRRPGAAIVRSDFVASAVAVGTSGNGTSMSPLLPEKIVSVTSAKKVLIISAAAVGSVTHRDFRLWEKTRRANFWTGWVPTRLVLCAALPLGAWRRRCDGMWVNSDCVRLKKPLAATHIIAFCFSDVERVRLS